MEEAAAILVQVMFDHSPALRKQMTEYMGKATAANAAVFLGEFYTAMFQELQVATQANKLKPNS
jgi:hypothetical protein